MNYLLLVSFVCICAMLLETAAHRRTLQKRLGKCVWAAPLRLPRTAVHVGIAYAVLIGSHIGDARTDWHSAAICCALGTSAVGYLIARLREACFEIRERGIVVGTLYLGWDELLGWGWGPDEKRILQVWSTPRKPRFFKARLKQPHATGLPWSSELAKLLEQYAPGLERSPEAMQAPTH